MLSGRKASAVSCALFLGSLAYLIFTLLRQPLAISDFRYLWTAGVVWAHHGNPYSPNYAVAGAQQFPIGPYPIMSWVYPFHWYVPARLVAALDPATGFRVWVVLSTILLGVGGWLSFIAARLVNARWTAVAVIAVATYACTSTPLVFLLRHGHPAALAVFGIAVIAYGVASRRPYLTGVGAALAMLKPHLGLPIVVALVAMPGGLLALVTGAALTLLGSVPAFAVSGIWPQVRGLIEQSTGGYQTVPYNSAGFMSGMPHFLYLATGHNFSITLSTVAAVLVNITATVWSRKLDPERRVALFIAIGCGITTSLVSLHGYDLTILLFSLPLLPLLRPGHFFTAMIGYALLWRAENLARLLGDFRYTPTIQTIAALLILCAWLAMAHAWKAKGNQPEA